MKQVKVYSTQTCPACHHAKNFLHFNKVDFDEIDVGRDRNAAMDMVRKSGQMGVPVIEVDGNIIVGFDEPSLRQALEL
ncbi:MAG: glutaredoxin family protein [Candidatus Woesearchaeota archaeon]